MNPMAAIDELQVYQHQLMLTTEHIKKVLHRVISSDQVTSTDRDGDHLSVILCRFDREQTPFIVLSYNLSECVKVEVWAVGVNHEVCRRATFDWHQEHELVAYLRQLMEELSI